MSVIEQAFVKALSRRTQQSPSGEPSQRSSETVSSPPDVSIHPKSEQSAIVWVDAVADTYLRRDQPHTSQASQARDRSTNQHTTGNSVPSGQARSRGARPVSLATDHRGPLVDAVSNPKQQTPAAAEQVSLRLDEGMRSEAARPSMTSAWIEASSSLVDTTSQQPGVVGPYFCETVIVQETYLPPVPSPVSQSPESPVTVAEVKVPQVSAPSKPLESVSIQAAPAKTKHSSAAIASAVAGSLRETLAEPPFAAVWEVDAFEFSDILIALFGDADLIRSIGLPLDRAVSEGLQSLLITSIENGSGRTTVAIGMALAAASAGLRVALVDATTASVKSGPNDESLADVLNLEAQIGWIEAVRSGASIAETAIYSIEDQLTIFPLVATKAGLPPTTDEFAHAIDALRKSFDLIIIDGPPCNEAAFRPLVSVQRGKASVDAAILVQDMRGATAEQANRVMDMLRRDRIAGLGVVQNFV
jgi:Mrp family chromosome partitioning ATPase